MSNVRFLVANICSVALSLTLALWAGAAPAAEAPFSGDWYIDLRTPQERMQNLECGGAYFKLSQVGDKITGDHGSATSGCGRLNEGGAETVKGVVVGTTAVLVVTSGRNGAMVLGRATKRGSSLQWTTLEELKPGEPEGDSPLILSEGLLTLRK